MRKVKLMKKSYQQRVSEKQRMWIRVIAWIVLILVVLCCFIAIVASIALTLKPKDCYELNNNFIPCGPQGDCVDKTSDNNNCGGCGQVCLAGGQCIDSVCELCYYNCTMDGDPCSVDPCNSTTGCAILDCYTDGDPCTSGICNSAGGGCPIICPSILLNAPTANFASATYKDASSARSIVGKVQVNSASNIVQVSISQEAFVGSTANRVIDCIVTGNITSRFNNTSGVLTLSGEDTPANYQTVLSTCFYKNPNQPIPSTATFYFLATNVIIKQQTVVTSTLTFAT